MRPIPSWGRVCTLGCVGVFLAFSCVGPQSPDPRPPAVRELPPPSEPTAPLPSSAGEPETPKAEGAKTLWAQDLVPEPGFEPLSRQERLKLRARAQAKILGVGKEIEDELGEPLPQDQWLPTGVPDSAVFANGNALGQYVPIENEEALGRFHEALSELRAGRLEGGKLRILAYGASHTQADFYPSYLRHYLQSRFGNGGLGFVHLARVNRSYGLRDARVHDNAFTVLRAHRSLVREEGLYGLFGAAAVSQSPKALARIRRVRPDDPDSIGTQLELYYALASKGGDFMVRTDDDPPVRLRTRHEAAEAVYHRFEARPDWETFEIRPIGNGAVRLFGVTIERENDGIVIDTLGIGGTRAASMLHWNQALWSEHVQRRNPRLVMLAYGTNEATDAGEPIAVYEKNLHEVLGRIERAAPDASCLLVGPGDFPLRVAGGFAERPRLLRIIDVQRRLARQHGCGFWDTYAFMGGAGSMQQWVAAKPKLARGDHIHFTVRGYVKLGMALGDALMRRLDEPLQPTRP